MKKYLIGVDIGGTKCAISLGSTSGNNIDILDKQSFSTGDSRDVDKIINRLLKTIESIIQDNKLDSNQIRGIGISCGGPLNTEKGIILSPPNLVGWDEVSIVNIFTQHFNLPVKLQNDANACTLAEWYFGAARGYNNVIFLTFGTGLGAGLILNGQLYTGANDMAGEVGHIRLSEHGPVGYGKMGSFEGFCSGGGIAQLGKTKILEQFQMGNYVSFCENKSNIDHIDAKAIAIAAKNGDPLAINILNMSGTALGKGLSIIIDILNPEIIIIGGIFTHCKDFLWPSADIVMQQECLPYSRNVCSVVSSTLSEQVGDYAALAVAISNEEVEL
ncbi:ROK family protein [Psychromonas arctica]|uniref:ROK family protein n=1 Tax=Psychromonas arctica TaxID=168275 RepID=UPI000426E606|nr:ROK family protein [Psychromonas arctica]